MKNILTSIFFLLSICMFSQNNKDVSRSLEGKKNKEFKSIYNAQVECIGVGAQGIFTVEAGVSQRKKKPDFSRARKAAIFSVLFNGIPGAYDYGCNPQPAILSVDSFEQNAEYFESFFETGKYAQFVSVANEEFAKITKLKKGYKVRLKIVVRYDDLKDKMKKDGLQTGMGDFF